MGACEAGTVGRWHLYVRHHGVRKTCSQAGVQLGVLELTHVQFAPRHIPKSRDNHIEVPGIPELDRERPGVGGLRRTDGAVKSNSSNG